MTAPTPSAGVRAQRSTPTTMSTTDKQSCAVADDQGRYRLAFRSGHHPSANHTITATVFVSEQEFTSLEQAVYAVCSSEHFGGPRPGIQRWTDHAWHDMYAGDWLDIAKHITIRRH